MFSSAGLAVHSGYFQATCHPVFNHPGTDPPGIARHVHTSLTCRVFHLRVLLYTAEISKQTVTRCLIPRVPILRVLPGMYVHLSHAGCFISGCFQKRVLLYIAGISQRPVTQCFITRVPIPRVLPGTYIHPPHSACSGCFINSGYSQFAGVAIHSGYFPATCHPG